jgi:hypothetical protein
MELAPLENELHEVAALQDRTWPARYVLANCCNSPTCEKLTSCPFTCIAAAQKERVGLPQSSCCAALLGGPEVPCFPRHWLEIELVVQTPTFVWRVCKTKRSWRTLTWLQDWKFNKFWNFLNNSLPKFDKAVELFRCDLFVYKEAYYPKILRRSYAAFGSLQFWAPANWRETKVRLLWRLVLKMCDVVSDRP